MNAGPGSKLGALPVRHAVLLSGVAVLWGFNFVPIRWALNDFPPFALAAIRFLLAAIPLVFFVPRPKIPSVLLWGYGFAIGLGQFGLLFMAIRMGFPAGLASLLIQAQVFLTMALSAAAMQDSIRVNQLAGACLGAIGITAVAAERRGGAGESLIGFWLVLAAAACWAIGNVAARVAARRHGADAFGVVVWSSLASPLPLAALSFWLEGGWDVVAAIAQAGARAWASVLFMAYAATLFGFAAWNRMLHRHSAGLVAPFGLLVPVAGMASAWVLLDEPLTAVEMGAGMVVVAGLAIATAGPWTREP